MKLDTQIGAVKFQTPLILASGYITETPEFFMKAQPLGCASMVTRSLKENPPPERAQVPAPRYTVFNDSMLNCEWGNEKPWTNWRDGWVKDVQSTNCPIIISLSGRDIESCGKLIEVFDTLNVDAFEINISCSHSGAIHGSLNVDIIHMQSLMKHIRQKTATPIWIKLSYSTMLTTMAIEAEKLGANAIVCTNSIGPGMLIDTATAKPKLGIAGGGGGLTGKAIFPIALWCVHQLYQSVKIPIIGCGGIFTADDVVQMLMAGASAVQLYTAPALHGHKVFAQIFKELQQFCLSQNATITELIGQTLQYTREHKFTSTPPVIDVQKCTGCEICVSSCAFDALFMSNTDIGKFAVITDNCNGCNACVEICPSKFNAITALF